MTMGSRDMWDRLTAVRGEGRQDVGKKVKGLVKNRYADNPQT